MNQRKSKAARRMARAYAWDTAVALFAAKRATKRWRVLAKLAPRLVAWLDKRAVDKFAPRCAKATMKAGKVIGRRA